MKNPSRAINILVIEDNPVSATVIRKHAERETRYRLSVRVATDGLVGYREARALRPDLILLDLNMPTYDGRSFLEMFQNEPKLQGCKVVVYAAADKPTLDQIQQEYPFVKVLQKPISPSQLVTQLVEILQAKPVVQSPSPTPPQT